MLTNKKKYAIIIMYLYFNKKEYIMFNALVILAYVLELMILALGIWGGYKLGFYKSIVRTVCLILLIPISIIVANVIFVKVYTAIASIIIK